MDYGNPPVYSYSVPPVGGSVLTALPASADAITIPSAGSGTISVNVTVTSVGINPGSVYAVLGTALTYVVLGPNSSETIDGSTITIVLNGKSVYQGGSNDGSWVGSIFVPSSLAAVMDLLPAVSKLLPSPPIANTITFNTTGAHVTLPAGTRVNHVASFSDLILAPSTQSTAGVTATGLSLASLFSRSADTRPSSGSGTNQISNDIGGTITEVNNVTAMFSPSPESLDDMFVDTSDAEL